MGRMELNRRRTLMLGSGHPHGPSSMARLLLTTSRTTTTGHRPAAWLPGAASWSDQQIADMAACARTAWHNRARGTEASV